MVEPWCVILAGREEIQRSPVTASGGRDPENLSPLIRRDPLIEVLRRAAAVTRPDCIAAVVSGPVAAFGSGPPDQEIDTSANLSVHNRFPQPRYRGTAYEVLFALILLERCIPPESPVLFLPADHVVTDEEVMTNSLLSMAEWITQEPRPIYLLGAVPQGPHDQLGYIVPWHDAPLMPVGVYEFVEMPDSNRARQLINGGALWNTFIFGGTVASLMDLFPAEFAPTISALRLLLQADPIDHDALIRLYENLKTVDFSRAILAMQTDRLHVIRLPRCGWWPLKPPTPYRPHPAQVLPVGNLSGEPEPRKFRP